MAHTVPPIDVVLEAPVSLGMLAVWAGDRRDADLSGVVQRALDAGFQAGLRALSEHGGWAAGEYGGHERVTLETTTTRHYFAGDHHDVARPHEHVLVALSTADGRRLHRNVLGEAATRAQTAYHVAMRAALTDDGIDLVRAATPAGWELAAAAADAVGTTRCGCASPRTVTEQIVPLHRWADRAPHSRSA